MENKDNKNSVQKLEHKAHGLQALAVGLGSKTNQLFNLIYLSVLKKMQREKVKENERK